MSTPSTPPSLPGARLAAALAAATLVQATITGDGHGAGTGTWRFTLRGRLVALRETLVDGPGESWLEARGGDVFAERNHLLGRLTTVARSVLEEPDVHRARAEAGALLDDIRAHLHGGGTS